MIYKTIQLFIFCTVTLCLVFSFKPDAWADNGWGIAAYYGRIIDADLANTFVFNSSFDDTSFVALAISKRMYTYKDKLDLELEGQIVKHVKIQHHFEINGLGTIRWLKFPWDRYIDTSAAFGIGLSNATQKPETEAKYHGTVSRTLVYLMFETTFALPKVPQWELLVRIHHRSGAYGTFHGITGASNAWALGLRYRF